MTECAPRYATERTGRQSLGRAAARVAKVLGQRLMPWQRQVVDTALEVGLDGRLVYRDVVLTVPRQQGKSYLVLVLLLTRALVASRQNAIYTAQTGLDARKKLVEDWLPTVQGSAIGPLVASYLAPGRESMRTANGSVIQLVASTAKAGHGMTVDLGVMDEAFAYTDARTEQALRPAMMTRPDPQLWVVSTAGTPDASPYLWERVQAGRLAAEAGLTESLCYFEWSADDDADPADPQTWRSCMPALGHTVDEDTVAAAQRSMPRGEFARAFLNRWVAQMGEPMVSLEHWQTLAEPKAKRPEWVVLGVDVAPQNQSAAIVAVGEDGNLLRSAVLEHGPGSDWVIPALERQRARLGELRLMADKKACAALMPELERVSDFKVSELDTGDVPAACEFWLKLVQESRLRHRGERELTIALDGAGQRKLGDGWAWSRRNSGADITPLVALTNATFFWLGSWGSP
jgi:phage terminase large subunit-like protein